MREKTPSWVDNEVVINDFLAKMEASAGRADEISDEELESRISKEHGGSGCNAC